MQNHNNISSDFCTYSSDQINTLVEMTRGLETSLINHDSGDVSKEENLEYVKKSLEQLKDPAKTRGFLHIPSFSRLVEEVKKEYDL